LIYLDRNNTPSIWSDIDEAIRKGSSSRKADDFKTILIIPEQAKFDMSLYNTVNSLSPQYIYECIKRIFGRKSHDCLSSENKPKVIEVILKFARLYDGVNFND
jgi:hypothetical protein